MNRRTARSIRFFIVDAFADRPFVGNPAAVVFLEDAAGDDRNRTTAEIRDTDIAFRPGESTRPIEIDDPTLASIAAEFNLSETAFLTPSESGYRLRWFTPKIEVDLCGHATLATAAALNELGRLNDGGEVSFATRNGSLAVRRSADRFTLDFPLTPSFPTELPVGLFSALGLGSDEKPSYVGRSKFDYLISLDSEDRVKSLSPDFSALSKVECRGVIVTAPASRSTNDDRTSIDFVSRFFAPAAGVDEDPVTGSAHCQLADYWSRRLGKRSLVAYQASTRGGMIEVEVSGDRVLLTGTARVVAEGRLRI